MVIICFVIWFGLGLFRFSGVTIASTLDLILWWTRLALLDLFALLLFINLIQLLKKLELLDRCHSPQLLVLLNSLANIDSWTWIDIDNRLDTSIEVHFIILADRLRLKLKISFGNDLVFWLIFFVCVWLRIIFVNLFFFSEGFWDRFFYFQGPIIHCIINNLLILIIELLWFSLMQFLLPLFYNFLQTVHEQLSHLCLPQIDDLNRRRGVHVENLISTTWNDVILFVSLHNLFTFFLVKQLKRWCAFRNLFFWCRKFYVLIQLWDAELHFLDLIEVIWLEVFGFLCFSAFGH